MRGAGHAPALVGAIQLKYVAADACFQRMRSSRMLHRQASRLILVDVLPPLPGRTPTRSTAASFGAGMASPSCTTALRRRRATLRNDCSLCCLIADAVARYMEAGSKGVIQQAATCVKTYESGSRCRPNKVRCLARMVGQHGLCMDMILNSSVHTAATLRTWRSSYA